MEFSNVEKRLQQYADRYHSYAIDRAREAATELAKKMKADMAGDAGLTGKFDQQFMKETFSQELMAMHIADQFKKAFMEEFSK